MNTGMIAASLGLLLYIEAACLVPALLVALFYGDGDSPAFIVAILATAVSGFAARARKPERPDIYPRDGFAIVGLGWLLASLYGALPFWASGAMPSVVDAIFESVSGFTTTGASVLRDIEILPKGVLFWRSFTHWVGGMGVLLLMIAIIPSARANTFNIMQAESPGPSIDKFVPKVGRVARILYAIYGLITLVQVSLLLAGGMPLYDSLIHTFGSVGTGGFSNKNASVSAYNSLYLECVIMFFMAISGVNFTLYYSLFRRDWRSVLTNEELRLYFFVIAVSTALVAIDTGALYGSFAEALRRASFQVVSVITTTGFATADFDSWPAFSRSVLLFLMLAGACAGSTGGGLKCLRLLLLARAAKREFVKLVHPNAVYAVRLNGRAVDDGTLSGVLVFFFMYVSVVVIAALVVSLDGTDLITSSSAVLSCVGNIGPGLGGVSPIGNYAGFSPFCKITLSLCMVTGRLEIYPILLLCSPPFWSDKRT
jgi:trk system potassium uptake protein TrkH